LRAIAPAHTEARDQLAHGSLVLKFSFDGSESPRWVYIAYINLSSFRATVFASVTAKHISQQPIKGTKHTE
jgi:hypothetical protein